METVMRMVRSNRQQKLSLATALFAVLAGCGGGGAGSAPSATPAPSADAAPPASAPPAGTPSPTAAPPPAGTLPAPAPPANPPAGTPPAGNVATLADFEACPDVLGFLEPSTTWVPTCLVGKRIVGTGPTKFNDPISPTVSCELLFKPDGSFEYTKDGMLFATTQPYTGWKDLVGVYNSNINSYKAGTNDIWIFQAKLGGNPAIEGSAISNQIAFGIALNKYRLTPSRNEYTLAFSVGGLANTQQCNLNLL
jgi:hypothetical protein